MRALGFCLTIGLALLSAQGCGDSEAPGGAAAGGGAAGATSGGKASGGAPSAAGKSSGGSGNGGLGGAVNASGSAAVAGMGGVGASADEPNAGGASSAAGNGGVTGLLGGAASDGGGANDGGAANDGGSAAGAGGASATCTAAANPGDKLIFVSSALYTGNLGGLAGADLKCQTLADAAGLCGTFKAWLSDATGNAADRLTHADGNYVLTTGEVVAAGWSALTSGTLQHAINQTEQRTPAPVGVVTCGGNPIAPVWSGATHTGIAVTNGSCSNWGSNGTGPGGAFGNANATSGAWSGSCQLLAVCQNTAALYCLEQ